MEKCVVATQHDERWKSSSGKMRYAQAWTTMLRMAAVVNWLVLCFGSSAGVLDQLLRSESIEPEEAEDLLKGAEQHGNGAVRERAEFIRSFLRARSRSSDEREPDESCPGG
jgi:hypothetical protein